jgi:hypothetical protein
MRTDPGGMISIVNGQHFKPKAKIYIDTGSGYIKTTVSKVKYNSTLTSLSTPLVSIGDDTSTELSFDISNVGGAYSYYGTYILYDANVKMELGFIDALGADVVVEVFEGQVKSFTENDKDMSISVKCRDFGGSSLLQKRYSTVIYENYRVDQWIELLATAAGMSFITHGYSPTTIPWLWLDDEPLLDQMIQAAQSEGGLVYIDESNTVHYWAPAYWISPTYIAGTEWESSLPWTITDQNTFTDFNIVSSDKNQYDDFIVSYQPRYIGSLCDIYELSHTIVIPAGTTKSFVVRFSDPAYDKHSVDYIITNGFGTDLKGSAYITYNGLTAPDPIADWGLHLHAEHWNVNIENTNTIEDAYLSKFTVSARVLVGAPDVEYVEEDPTSHARVYRLTGNPYIQTPEQAESLAALMRDRFEGDPCIQATASGVKPNPLLQVGDTVLVTSVNANLSAHAFYVIGITYAGPKYNMSLTLVDAGYYFESDSYFIIGYHHLVNTAHTLEGELYY